MREVGLVPKVEIREKWVKVAARRFVDWKGGE